ncbi:hypothetical protein WN944_023919 [Citrus x changshan-huyou]|uniref:TPX2 C-terminal domain-containing protein n=1 Tax=Citrus x changshan-huyou TaxID=2935761 RepID=A0AAP0QBI0_9ROSI
MNHYFNIIYKKLQNYAMLCLDTHHACVYNLTLCLSCHFNWMILQMIEEEEIRLMRKEMIPRAQLMPLFDRPFFPQRFLYI